MKQKIKYFLIIEIILYIIFLSLDLTKHYAITTPVKYTSIVLCFIFSLYSNLHHSDKLISIALFFTIMADWFLLVMNEYEILGLICFIVVQLIYMIKLGNRLLVLRVILPVLIIFLTSISNPIDILAIIYFFQLLINAMISWRDYKNIGFIFALGLTLFVCCDTCVGLFNLTDMGLIHEFTRVGMWLFYLPSQVLIVMSGITLLK
ncbi:MAG: lysoplasmalogenase [Erysipelotrichaceae bacterium]|nr:lysoplasmalogenase [Erysipelotrichaceae bacterium]